MYSPVHFILFVFILCLGSSCTGVYMALGPSADSGTFEVSGIEAGIGGKLEIGIYEKNVPSPWGLSWLNGFHGYSSPGDGDPIFMTQINYHRLDMLGQKSYLIYGAGLGALSTAGNFKVMTPVHVGVDYQFLSESPSVFISLTNYIGPAIGDGSPAVDLYQSLQLSLGYRF